MILERWMCFRDQADWKVCDSWDWAVQILQWTFAGAPGHPALREICDTIARTILDPIDEDTNLDTLERTGPGLWTDIILKHAHLHPIAKVTSSSTLRDGV